MIWLDTPRLTCFMRVLLRLLRNQPRPDRADGCEEKLDMAFLKFVWTFDRGYRQGIEAVRQKAGPQVPVLHLRGKREVRAFLEGLPAVDGDSASMLNGI